MLMPKSDVIQKLQEGGFFARNHEKIAKKEAWSASIAPFIAKSFHNTTYGPVFIDEQASDADLQKTAKLLSDVLPEDTLMLAQSLPKTSSDPTVAEYPATITKMFWKILIRKNLQHFHLKIIRRSKCSQNI